MQLGRISENIIRGKQRLRAYLLFESPFRMLILNGMATLTRWLLEAIFHSPFRRYLLNRYQYQFSPQQLCFLCQCIADTRDVLGNVAEIGCNRGFTTVFLCHFMSDMRMQKEYIAVDTFSGFVSDDVAYEIRHRKKRDFMYVGFQVNKKKWFDAALKQRGIRRVRSIEADVNVLDLCSLGPMSFVLVDVDLYRPTLKSLSELYSVLTPGGIIIVDDCNPNNWYWDGAYHAYSEFMRKLGESPKVVFQKLGVVRKSL